MLHQFTKEKSKFILSKENENDRLNSLLSAKVTDIGKKLYVFDVVSSRKNIEWKKGEKNENYIVNSRGCDNTNGDYKLLGYEEVDEVTYGGQNPASNQYDSNCNCIVSASPAYGTYRVSQLKIRTLKWVRTWPFNGYWADKQSSNQAANGQFKIHGSYGTNWFTSLGFVFSPSQLTSYSISNTTGETANFYFTLFAGSGTVNGFSSQSYHTFTWEIYGCSCYIPGFP